MFKILAKLQKIFYSAKKLRHKMFFLLKIHDLVAKSVSKVVPQEDVNWQSVCLGRECLHMSERCSTFEHTLGYD